jgi:hypothetical protein
MLMPSPVLSLGTSRAAVVAVTAVIGLGCGGAGDEDSSTQAGTESETGSETEGTETSDTGNEVDCISAASGIGIELYSSERECTVLVCIAHEGHKADKLPAAGPDTASPAVSSARSARSTSTVGSRCR